MQVKDSVALVTGSNQGIGRGFVEVLLERGARRIYATARRPETLDPLVALDPSRVIVGHLHGRGRLHIRERLLFERVDEHG